jgi:hypothetical protein
LIPIISVKSLTGVDAGRREPSDSPAKQIVVVGIVSMRDLARSIAKE